MSAFDGAEAAVDAERKSALDALAQFGRRGLEAAVVAQKEGAKIQTDASSENAGFGSSLNVGTGGQAELDALGAGARQAYAANSKGLVDTMASESGALGQVAGNYFNQVRQAVPLERTAASQITDQYKAAYAERQAAVAAAARRDQELLAQAALQAQLERERQARDAEFQRLILLGLQPDEAEAAIGSSPFTPRSILPGGGILR
jgi:hypothetical protein